jgi:DNA-directed RNA polymerase subunit RPC12/RpoP
MVCEPGRSGPDAWPGSEVENQRPIQEVIEIHRITPKDGLECRSCGCPDLAIVDRRERWGTLFIKWRCLNRSCGKTFMADDSQRDAPRYPGTICPECGSDRVPVQHTAGLVRSHKCRACGHPFKSVERA